MGVGGGGPPSLNGLLLLPPPPLLLPEEGEGSSPNGFVAFLDEERSDERFAVSPSTAFRGGGISLSSSSSPNGLVAADDLPPLPRSCFCCGEGESNGLEEFFPLPLLVLGGAARLGGAGMTPSSSSLSSPNGLLPPPEEEGDGLPLALAAGGAGGGLLFLPPLVG